MKDMINEIRNRDKKIVELEKETVIIEKNKAAMSFYNKKNEEEEILKTGISPIDLDFGPIKVSKKVPVKVNFLLDNPSQRVCYHETLNKKVVQICQGLSKGLNRFD